MVVTANLFVKQRGSTTALKQPKEFSTYSRTSEDQFFIDDDRNLRYYYLPDAAMDSRPDLASGVKKMKDKTFPDPCTLHGLLKAIKSNEERKQKSVKADIITFRGIIRKLISTAFDSPSFNPVNLRIVSFDGQLFIKDVFSSDVELKSKEADAKACFSGYKFESLATLPQPLPYVTRELLEKRPKRIVNSGEEFISVVRTGVGSTKLILGAEIDCVFDFKEEGKDNLKHYAELKCTGTVTNAAQARKFERKIFKTWLQCFLVGIPRIIYGFRDEKYILKSIEEFSTDEVPLLLKSNNPALCSACIDAIKWYGAFTEWLLKTIPRDSPSEIKAYMLVFENNHLRLTEIEQGHEEYDGLVKGEVVLSQEFREWRKSLA
ncbi:hypothetical protein HG535_0G05030 [Zygotorulaspora mrakii]|uniref:Decapping nuclease n=1 Tax=Zygotorulaspora mrakii TaxID=42260 RepID=A0A7H9B7V4_ZYGMR|nr:uncharacterized protein HG535_0G05030 [Zygotorulaspora mrakii]QLG74620.1 hypothetical protein HG535_0G05030 [Zygotorulaspora mrakii]